MINELYIYIYIYIDIDIDFFIFYIEHIVSNAKWSYWNEIWIHYWRGSQWSRIFVPED